MLRNRFLALFLVCLLLFLTACKATVPTEEASPEPEADSGVSETLPQDGQMPEEEGDPSGDLPETEQPDSSDEDPKNESEEDPESNVSEEEEEEEIVPGDGAVVDPAPSDEEEEEQEQEQEEQMPSPVLSSVSIIDAISDAPAYSPRNHARCAVDSLRSTIENGLWYSGDVSKNYFESDFGPYERAITLVLGETADLSSVKIRWFQGGSSVEDIQATYGRKYQFMIQASSDGKDWGLIYPQNIGSAGMLAVSDCMGELETYDCSFTKANYVRIVGVGSDGGIRPADWMYFAIRQIEVYGYGYGMGGGNARDASGFEARAANPKGGEDTSELQTNKELTVYFVRHGQSDYTVSTNATAHLNAYGYLQAVSIAKYFNGREIDVVFSSPYQRCLDTIDPLCTYLSLDLIVNPDIYERTVGSEVETIPSGFAEAQWQDYDLKLEGGESLYDVQTRMIRGLGEIFRFANENEGVDTVVVSSHAMALSVLLSIYANDWGPEIYARLHTGTPCVKCVFVDNECVEMEFINIPN